jgi:xylose isomerase
MEKSLHSVCRWTFHAGKGGFVPADSIPSWNSNRLNTAGMIRLVAEKIRPRLPDAVQLGIELHYDNEVDERSADEASAAMVETGIPLAMITPGAHGRFAYGGIASLDPEERARARDFGRRTLDLAYGPLRRAWHPEPGNAPSFVIWNGSFGYDLASIGIGQMYRNLKQAIAALCGVEAEKGGKLFLAIEPKPNEGHPALLLPTVASAIAFWRKIESDYGISLHRKGVNKEFGHSEMIGLDPVYDTVEEIDNGMLVHMHMNSQGLTDGIILGGPGKYDIDHGVRINGMTIAIAGLIQEARYCRWKGHDMQARPYDNADQAIDRVIRSILAWEACAQAARDMDRGRLLRFLETRQTARAEDMIREAVVLASRRFGEMYG